MIVAAWLMVAVLASPGPAAEPPLQGPARTLVGADQGVSAVAEDGTVLAALNETRGVHPASVTKVATTLALLERLGVAHRFDTRLLGTAPRRDGVVESDLLVEADGDPALVFEDAIRMLAELHTLGVRRVRGALRVRGPLLFNWEPDASGRRLRRALEGRDGAAAWTSAALVWPAIAGQTPRELGLRFDDGRPATGPTPRPLVVHRSAPLLQIVKAFNGYSNNVFHELSARIGGPPVVQQIARSHLPAEQRAEVIIDNAAGEGKTNRLSPRAAVGLLEALDQEIVRQGHRLVDVLPVTGMDEGTLRERLTPGLVVGKTGTFGSVGASALVGVLRTRRWGRVRFAVLNRNVAVPEAHRRQDAFVHALADAADAQPWDYRGGAAPVYAATTVETLQDGPDGAGR